MVAGKASKARPVEPFYIITPQMTCELLAPSPVTAWGKRWGICAIKMDILAISFLTSTAVS